MIYKSMFAIVLAVLVAAFIVPEKAQAQPVCKITLLVEGDGVAFQTAQAMHTSLVTALRTRGARVYEASDFCKLVRARLSVAAQAQANSANNWSLPIPPLTITLPGGTREIDLSGFIFGQRQQAAMVDQLRLEIQLLSADGEYRFSGWVAATRATEVQGATSLDIFTSIGGKSTQSQMVVRVETPSQLLDAMANALVSRIPQNELMHP